MIHPYNNINQTEASTLNKDYLAPINLEGRSVNLKSKLSSAHKVALCFGAAAFTTGLVLTARHYLTSDASTGIRKVILDNKNLKPDAVANLLTKTVQPATTIDMALKIKDDIALKMRDDIPLKLTVYLFGGTTILGVGCGVFLCAAQMLISCGCIRIGCGASSDD